MICCERRINEPQDVVTSDIKSQYGISTGFHEMFTLGHAVFITASLVHKCLTWVIL